MKRLMLIAFIVMWSVVLSGAEEFGSYDYEAYNKIVDQRIYSGWQGIAFMCVIDEDKPLEKKICENFTIDLELVCASNNVKVKVVKPNLYGMHSLTWNRYKLMPLELRIRTTDVSDQYAPVAVYAELYSDMWYDDAVSMKNVKSKKPYQVRAGNLTAESLEVISSGPANEIAPSFNSALEAIFKKFLTGFNKNNKEHLITDLK